MAKGGGQRKEFQGKEGKKIIFEIFKNSEIVKHHHKSARRLTQIAKLNEYEKGQEIYVQGERARGYLYFVLSGKIDLLKNGRLITTVGTGQLFGEFPFIKPELPYTVTARCQERAIIAKVTYRQFQLLANKFPVLWRNIAEKLVDLLNTTSNLLYA
jgi:CRP/FNR family transcriptional regulator, cyclic AMP receptor protein